jgi:hypothetical protein
MVWVRLAFCSSWAKRAWPRVGLRTQRGVALRAPTALVRCYQDQPLSEAASGPDTPLAATTAIGGAHRLCLPQRIC